MKVKSCSYSSDKKLARCEKMFDYRYTEGLRPKTKKLGLFKGDWVHQLLEANYLNPGVDSKKGWRAKFRELKKKWNKLFDEEKEYYGITLPDDILELMEHYMDYWSNWDSKWKILQVEKAYELTTKIGFPIRWKSDLIVQEGNSIILVETKAKKDIPDSSERVLQPQVHAYAWLLKKSGVNVDTILWNYIRTTPIPRPQIKKNGELSERKINTDQRSYLKSLAEAGIKPETEEDVIGLQEKLKSLPETLTLERITNSVNLRVGEMFVRQWVERHKRALQITMPLLNWNRNCKWDCDYYNLCQTDIRQDVDRNLIIQKEFTTKDEQEELK